MPFNYFFNGAFNVNPSSNLILTVRLTRKLPRTKRLGQGKSSFIVFIFRRDFWREKKRGMRVLERILNQEREDILQHKNRGAAQNLRGSTEIEKRHSFRESVQQYGLALISTQSDISVQQYGLH